jgi:hypothetical protein
MEKQLLTKIVLALILFLFQCPISAQMYVSPDSFVFASNEVVFINQKLELKATTSNFYLRENAQLIQGSTVAGINSGEGSLSVFQEGSANSFQYNYWCSPVGASNISSANSPFGITQLKDVTGLITSNNPAILPSNNYNGTSSPLGIAPYWINKLTATSSYSSWIPVGANATIAAGEGFTMKGTAGTNSLTVNGIQNNPGSKQRYDFRGKPNDGTISIPVAFEQFTLTGNPYPSDLDLTAFLTEQTNCTGIAYFWEQDATANSHFIADYKGGYGTFSPVSRGSTGLYVPATFFSYDGSGNQGANTGTGGDYQRQFLPIGQGFLINGAVNGAVQMKNTYRVFRKIDPTAATVLKTNGSKKEVKSAAINQMQSISGFDYTTVNSTPVPQIRFNTLLNNQGVRQLALAFVPEATDGVDRGMDALSSGDSAQADVYFVINDSPFVINALNFDIDKKIPIGFKSMSDANFKITVKEVINFNDANSIYLHDKVNNTFHDIKNDFCELNLSAGENNTQFEITFKTDNSLAVEETIAKKFVVFQDNTAKNLVINNPFLKDIESCGFYDVAGKLIFIKNDLTGSSTYQFSTAGLGDGIYIVKIIAKDKEVFGKKVIIKN